MTMKRASAVPYTAELGVAICTRLSQGETISRICEDEGFPDVSTVHRWRRDIAEFRKLEEVAREDQADTYAARMLDLVNAPPPMITDEHGIQRVDNGAVQHLRVKIDTLKWICSKLKPRTWGDRAQVEITGGAMSLELQNEIDQLEAARRIAFALYRADAQTIESTAPVASREALIEHAVPENELPE